MNVYRLAGGLWCEACGEQLRRNFSRKWGTDKKGEPTSDADYPQGPFPDGGGEADTPQQCAAEEDCLNVVDIAGHKYGVWLENAITPVQDEKPKTPVAPVQDVEPDTPPPCQCGKPAKCDVCSEPYLICDACGAKLADLRAVEARMVAARAEIVKIVTRATAPENPPTPSRDDERLTLEAREALRCPPEFEVFPFTRGATVGWRHWAIPNGWYWCHADPDKYNAAPTGPFDSYKLAVADARASRADLDAAGCVRADDPRLRPGWVLEGELTNLKGSGA